MSLIEQEPLLRKREQSLSFAVADPEFVKLWKFYQDALTTFWPPSEVKLIDDVADWEQLDKDTQNFIKTIFGFFSGADAIVNVNLAENFLKDIGSINAVQCFYTFQMMMENVHNEVYGNIINALIADPGERNKLLNAVHEMPHIAELYNWSYRWIQRTEAAEYELHPSWDPLDTVCQERAKIWTIAKRLVAFACVEGIMFSGPFCSIFWLKEKGILPGLTFANEQISKDEGLHTQFACCLYKDFIVNKPPEEEMLEIVKEAVAFEKVFIGSCLDKLVGINKDSMSQYIEFVADKLLNMLGYKAYWKTPLPISMKFMEKISFNRCTQQFERTVAEYSIGQETASLSAPVDLECDY